MKTLKIYSFLSFLFLGSTSVPAQSMLDLYFGGNKDSLGIEAFKLIHTSEPTFNPTIPMTEPEPATIAEMGFEQVYKSENRFFIVRDSKRIFTYRFPNESQNTIILIHGVASSAYLYNKTAGLMQEATQAEVYAIDLRGHGQSEGKSGDVDYINQYVGDLADIIKTVRTEKPNGKIIIAGHSMGGGIALRYAMANQYEQPDGFLLFAPLIGHNSPALLQGQPTENLTEEPFMKIHIERIIGLTMLNEIDNHDFDSLPILFFNLPETVPLRKYSYRANKSTTPDDYVSGLSAVHKPVLVLIGSDDEAFSAAATKEAILKNSSGEIQIINNTSHNGVRHNAQSFTFIKDWFSKL
ncbi:alpha/beta hydrolase [Gillisia limnaea]|uniref:Alpha/beta hydrolase fold containing protein n=1 Tax=Gillisia limnaea (strain DSM 15749 / LMG 21470 / R-8282) TaxID=865937 RepID=H2BXE3_GILLR|nr:alpha/beta fold hydrolase [Gillisia limnaea]EHQ02025.1 alpha/beta hydrolase fold containing protein [Gillisia limnaea DSM 15749]